MMRSSLKKANRGHHRERKKQARKRKARQEVHLNHAFAGLRIEKSTIVDWMNHFDETNPELFSEKSETIQIS